MAKPCNSFQLTGHCKNGITCLYDHAPMDERLLKILKQIVHDYPCKMRGACRDKTCQLGHICYNAGCKQGRRGAGCRLARTMHQVDPSVYDWIAAHAPEESDIKTVPNHDGEDLLIEDLDDNDDADVQDVKPPTRDFDDLTSPDQSTLQSQHSPNALFSSRWNDTPQNEHPAAQAASWSNARKSSFDYDRPQYPPAAPSPAISGTSAPYRPGHQDTASHGSNPLSPTPISSNGNGSETSSRPWNPPRGPAKDHPRKWESPAPAQHQENQDYWPAPVLDDDGPIGW